MPDREILRVSVMVAFLREIHIDLKFFDGSFAFLMKVRIL